MAKSGHTVQTPKAVPMYLQIYEKIRTDIETGAVSVGDSLPSERQLQKLYRVSRTTVQNAYDQLEAMGYVTRHAARGTFVATPPQWPSAVKREASFRCARPWQWMHNTFLEDLMESASRDYTFDFEAGRPDIELFPLTDMQLALEHLFSKKSRDVLLYSPTMGLPVLRQAISEILMPQRGIHDMPAENILITSGAMQAIDLIAKLFIEPNDMVVVAKPTFPGALQRFATQGARIVGIPVDSEGIDVDQLASVVRQRRPSLIYTQPTCQNPTGVTLSPARRERLLRIARDYNIPVVEDDACGFLSSSNTQALRAQDDDVLYVGTFSKLVAPGFRVGYVTAPANIARRLAGVKQVTDLHTGSIGQLLLESWLTMGGLEEHLQRSRDVYRERLRTAVATLRCSHVVPVYPAEDGFYLFCSLPDGFAARALQQRGAERGVIFASGDAFSSDGDLQGHLRLCVSALPPASIRVGLRRLTQIVEEQRAPVTP